MRLFALAATRAFGEAVAAALGTALAPLEEREFEGGEHKGRPLESVRGHDVYVIQSLGGDARRSVDERLCRLLFLLATLRDHGAARLTAVIPYLAYARKDRRTQPRDPLTARYVAELLESTGVDTVMTLEVHNVVAYENAFRRRTVHLEMHELLARRLLPFADERPIVVASPDPGGVKRAQLFREHLEALAGRRIGAALIDKRRRGGVLGGELFAGDVRGASVLLVDDMIVTGGTLLRAASSCRRAGAAEVVAIAAHGLFQPGVEALLGEDGVDRLVVSDSVDPGARLDPAVRARTTIVGAAPFFADAIARRHGGATPDASA